MEILEACAVWQQMLHIPRNFWDELVLALQHSSHHRELLIHLEQGATQGSVLSTIPLNIVFDAMNHQLETEVPPSLMAKCHADDEKLVGTTAADLQPGLDWAEAPFAALGVEINAAKTKAMIGHSQIPLGQPLLPTSVGSLAPGKHRHKQNATRWLVLIVPMSHSSTT